MNKRGRYATRQQIAVQEFMIEHSGYSFTVDEVYDGLAVTNSPIGKTTVYRALERLLKDSMVISIPDSELGCMRYGYVAEKGLGTCLICNSCHKVEPLNCGCFTGLLSHIEQDHQFVVESHQTFLFGTCKECLAHEK